MAIALKRAYEEPAASDGCRVLVERLWPRGLSKQAAAVDLWVKDVAPSTELRRWSNHEPDKWKEFERRYVAELNALGEQGSGAEGLKQLRERVAAGRVTFVFASREMRYNNAVALRAYLERT